MKLINRFRWNLLKRRQFKLFWVTIWPSKKLVAECNALIAAYDQDEKSKESAEALWKMGYRKS